MDGILGLIRLSGRKKVSLIRQTEAAECGLACLAMVADFHDYRTDLAAFRRRFAISLKGSTLKTLIEMADELGFDARALKADLDTLDQVALPAILHWNLNHFVVLTGIEPTLKGLIYRILDPALGEVKYRRSEFSRLFTGIALELRPSERFRPKTERAPFGLTQMWSRIVGLRTALIQVGFLSLIMQLFAFAGPFYMQLAIDNAIPAFDIEFLTALAAAFGAIAVLNLVTSTLRDIILLKLGNALGYQLVSNLFRQMLRLPVSYFEKRHTGDLLSRFDSTQPISDTLTHGLIQAVIDGFMAFGTLALMFFYSWILASISVIALVIYVSVRLTWFGVLRHANVGLIVARAAESSAMIETVRGMPAIKSFARERVRQRVWQNKKAQVVNSSVKVGRIQVWFDCANNAVMAIENVLFVYVAVILTIDAKFTIGMIFAFQAYKTQFLGSAMRLVNQAIQWRLLDVHLSRIADIALSPAEEDPSASLALLKPPLRGVIEVRDVSFAYGRGENEVLRRVSLAVNAGETVALVGPSGGGKTTLMKIVMGFYMPSKGEVLIDGEPLIQFGLSRFRTQIGIVLQEDILYAGSLAENIAFFDPDLDLDRVKEVAKLACIDEEINAMPMAYESLVGDMGSALSGGQKQRVLLARALYSDPKILFMDEGTAHLDLRTEAAVNASVSRLGMTRLIIAHRPETIRMADRIMMVSGGVVTELKAPIPG